mgnify:CR=1 FL=1
MDKATRDSVITGYETLIPALTLPDPDDRHVLAAAIAGRCDVIVTRNLKDFPEDALAAFHIEAQHPDEFRARLARPPYTAGEYLAALTRQGLVATACELRPFAELL